MENIDLSFIQRFRSLVFVSGKPDIANSLLDILKKLSKENDWSNFNFKAVDPLAVPVRKNKIYNSKGSREGIFRSNWLKKRLEIIPSTVIFAYDLRDVPLGKEGAVFSDYNKHKDGLRARHITSVFMFLISKPQQAAYEKQLEFFRKALETDSKFIFFLPQSFENNVPSIRKLEKILPEASKNHYNELLKKHKRRVNKSYELIQAHEFNTRMFIKMAILYELLLKPDKSQAQYEQAYNTISTVLLQYHQSRINQASRSIPGVYLPANFDSIHWLEELRYLADVIRIRLFYLAVQKNDINEAHRLLYSHINFYKDKIDYVDPRFKFEEFKWKMRVYYYVCNVLLNSYEINPKFCFFDANYISSRVFAFADFAIKRRQAFLNNNPDPNPPANIAVDINYLGFDRYKYAENEYGEMPRTTDVAYLNEILKSRVAAENKLNVYEDPIDLLQRLLKCMKPKDGAAFLTEYSLAQLYYLNGHRDRFLEMVPQIIALIGKKSWNDLIKNILGKNEQFLSHNKDWESLMVNCFNFFILNQSNPERIKLAQESISKLGKSNNYKFEVREQTLFNIEVAFEPPVIKYLHDFTGKITMTIPEFLREYIDEIELIFNDAKYYIKENVTTLKKEGKHDIFTFTTSATHLVQTNRLNIVEINLRGRQQTSNGSEVGLLFTIKEPAFLSNQNNILLLQLVDDLQVKIESSQPGYTNEKVDVRLRLFKKDQETKIKYVSVFLYVYERGRVHDIVPGFFPRDIALYHVDDRRELVEMSKDSNLTMLEFDNESQEMVLNFVVRATVEGAVTYVFKVKYDVIKMENDKMIEIPKEITEHFTSRTLSPFVTFLNWKTNLKEINHLRDMKTMIHRQPLPLNNTCCLNITFSPIYHDIIVQHVKVNLNRSSQVMILKEPSVPSNQLLLKNQVFTTHLMLRPVEETEELAVGDLELHITRKENQEKAEKEPIIFNVSLQLISVHKRAFTVFIEADTSCEVGKLVPYKVTIINNTFHLHKLDFQVLPNEAFYFSGRSRYIIDTLPKSTKEIKLHMVPVEIGKHKAPTCIVKCLTMEGETLLDTDETRIIYVFPQKHFTEELDLV